MYCAFYSFYFALSPSESNKNGGVLVECFRRTAPDVDGPQYGHTFGFRVYRGQRDAHRDVNARSHRTGE